MGSANYAHTRRQGSVSCNTGRVYLSDVYLSGETKMDYDFELMLYGQKRTQPATK